MRKRRPLRLERSSFFPNLIDSISKGILLLPRWRDRKRRCHVGRTCPEDAQLVRVTLALDAPQVGFQVVLDPAVPAARVEVVVLHLRVDLIEGPVILSKAVDRSHRPSAVTTARAVHVELSGRRI